MPIIALFNGAERRQEIQVHLAMAQNNYSCGCRANDHAQNSNGDDRYCEKLAERSPQRFQEWNSIASDIKPAAVELVRLKTRAVTEENDLPKVFLDTVEWDIVHLCMEAEFADVYPPGFYAAQAYWYTKGHFPCGWEGEFPEGTRIIY